MMKIAKLIPEFDLCTGCNICMLTCCEENFGGYNPRYAMLKVEDLKDGIFVEPVACNQCDNAACERVCPVSAISKKNIIKKDNEGNEISLEVVSINNEKCTGCGRCEEYCPKGVIVIKDKKAYKCELCDGEPACIKNCPKGAIKLYREGVEKND
ncbi:4Fe-4S dicluster domain-containing protein [Natranaerofaba carboxydovora]|uniref:4Fe-4S dicluster domain-containing protein n=1 Tax=Natranaerofaba carboxydovora TaxID=2742683 RepID=UPI001F14603A|nr:4Fe-4S dicluster domain-containing protein [Natranaerofaba carboxydovora]